MTFSDEKGVLKRKGSYTFQPFFYNLVHGVSDNNMPLHERAPILGLENLEVRYILRIALFKSDVRGLIGIGLR